MIVISFIFWIILNGKINLEIATIGIFVSIIVNFLVKRVIKINFNGLNFLNFIKIFPDSLFYLIVLLIEILKANISIIRLVLAQNIELEPCLIKFKTKLRTGPARVALANSITLTPGTITVSLENNELLVHALNREMAKGLEDSIFERILNRMEKKFYV